MKRIIPFSVLLLFAAQAWCYGQEKADSSDYFVVVEEMPRPADGIGAIQKNVVYPEIMKRAGIEGTVYVEAFLDESGNVVRTGIVKGVKDALDQAAMEAIRKTKFTPGKQKGIAVKTRIAIPIRFKLNAMGETQKNVLYPAGYPASGGGVEVPANAQWKTLNTPKDPEKVLLILDSEGGWAVTSFLTKEEALKLSEDLKDAAAKASPPKKR